MKKFKPTKKVAEEAKVGLLMWRATNKKCATRVGVTRANQLAKRKPVSYNTVIRMWKFFSRHYKNRKNKPPKCGQIAWLLWGGNEGALWAYKILEKEGYFDV